MRAGKNDPKAYLEWEKKVELIFECYNYSEEKKVKLTVIEFTDYAIIWWDQFVINRRRNHERPIETWEEMKASMRRWFLKRKGIQSFQNLSSSTSWRSNGKKDEGAIFKSKTEPLKRRDDGPNVNKGKKEFQTRNHDIKCFCCLGRTMIARIDGEVETKSEGNDDQIPSLEDVCDDDVEYPVEGESLGARCALSAQVKEDDMEQQRENIFHTKCHFNNKVCSMIIDEGSCTNVASTTLVENLNLPTLKYPRLYKLQWLNDFGEVKDEVLCDVVSMHAGHILLGRPWFKNRHFSVKDNKTITLVPLTPRQRVKKNERKTKKQAIFYAKASDVNSAFYTNQPIFVLFYKETCFNTNEFDESLPSVVVSFLQEYKDVFPNDVPSGLPTIRGIEHQIDFVLSATIPNRQAYRSNPVEIKELQR
ncbi:hypothetical protein ACB092_02G126200 [Castanea dentata]